MDNNEYHALSGRVIAEIIPNKDKTESGLAIISKDLPQYAKVISVGAKWKTQNPPCKKDDVIIFRKYSPVALEEHGKKGISRGLVTIPFGDILGVVNG